MGSPQEVNGAKVLKLAVVSVEVKPTGVRFGPAAALAIARYPDDDGTYLFRLDDACRVVTDTWHESLEDALHQASLEYEGLRWLDVVEV